MGGAKSSGLKSISLKNLAQKVQQPVTQKVKQVEKKQEEPIDMSWNDAFDQDKLDEAWRRFTRQHETQPRIHTIYKNHPPKLVNENSLKVLLRNKTQEYELNKERSNIVSYLRRCLRNAKISLEFEISLVEDKGPQKAFTVADKFKVMMEKNPSLAIFKKEFNLDLE